MFWNSTYFSVLPAEYCVLVVAPILIEISALARKIHVCCEKPLTVTAAEADEPAEPSVEAASTSWYAARSRKPGKLIAEHAFISRVRTYRRPCR